MRGRRVRTLLGSALVLLFVVSQGAPSASALGPSSLFDVAQVVYPGGNHAPHPTAARRLAWEIRKRTSVDTLLEPSEVRLGDPRLYRDPFLYLAGDRAFPAWPEEHATRLGRFLVHGGFLLVDDAEEGNEGGFDRSIRRELSRALPSARLEPVRATHVLYRSFYLVARPYGRREGPPELLAIQRDGRLLVVYSRHDLGGAWARDNYGNWERPVVPGGERQREAAFRLGVNIALYSLCLSYKDDAVHLPFLQGRGPPP